MFRRYDNLKRAICLLGVVLALSPSLQETHAFCFIAGCAPTHSSGEADGSGDAEHTSCSGHDCSASDTCQSNSNDSEHHQEPGEQSPAQCPCPPACWCHQSPSPLELPKSGPAPFELLVAGPVYVALASFDTTQSAHLSRFDAISAIDSSVKSAPQVCAQLCRFLT